MTDVKKNKKPSLAAQREKRRKEADARFKKLDELQIAKLQLEVRKLEIDIERSEKTNGLMDQVTEAVEKFLPQFLSRFDGSSPINGTFQPLVEKCGTCSGHLFAAYREAIDGDEGTGSWHIECTVCQEPNTKNSPYSSLEELEKEFTITPEE